MAGCRVYLNCSNTDQPLGTSGVNWIEFQSGSDKIIFTQGNATVADGQPLPSQQQLISAGIQLNGTDIIIPTYLLSDLSANLLRAIGLMGNTVGRYVWAFDFDGATASEPVLEFWDDSNLSTLDITMLGAGVAASSFIQGITTTSNAPSVDWLGSRLAGSSSGHFLYLNDLNGPLTGADTLYANLKVTVPASQTNGFSGVPVWVCKWLSN